jgi:hypothetical protein
VSNAVDRLGLFVAAAGLFVSAYQTHLVRQDLENFRKSNLNEHVIQGCKEYLSAADGMASSLEVWAGQVIGDGPQLSSDLPAEQYAMLVNDRAVKLMEVESALATVGTEEMGAGIEAVENARVAVFLMTEGGSPGSRENVNMWLKDINDGIEVVRSACKTEMGLD